MCRPHTAPWPVCHLWGRCERAPSCDVCDQPSRSTPRNLPAHPNVHPKLQSGFCIYVFSVDNQQAEIFYQANQKFGI